MRIYLTGILFLLVLTGTTSYGQLYSVKRTDIDGKEIDLSKFRNNPATVFVFLSPDCPLCQNYSKTLNEQSKYFLAKKVKYIGVVSGKNYSVQEINHYRKLFAIEFPIVLDPDFKLRDILKATTTPQAFVTDKNGKVKYSGKIDDWAIDLGKHKSQPTEHYLKKAVTQVITGKPVSVKETKPVGCVIE